MLAVALHPRGGCISAKCLRILYSERACSITPIHTLPCFMHIDLFLQRGKFCSSDTLTSSELEAERGTVLLLLLLLSCQACPSLSQLCPQGYATEIIIMLPDKAGSEIMLIKLTRQLIKNPASN